MSTTFTYKAVLVILVHLGLPMACHAIDSSSFEFSVGNRTHIARIGTQFNWGHQWQTSFNTHITGYWDLSAARWRENRFHNIVDNIENIDDVGITPVFRFQNTDNAGLYAEAGIGAHYLHGTYDNNGRQLSDNFQFGTHIGFGYVFSNRVDIGLRLQHISNGGIKNPNDGVNFAGLRVAYPFK
jgi:lipid A 3-O-deacylase